MSFVAGRGPARVRPCKDVPTKEAEMNKRNVVILGTLLVAAVVGFVYWKGIYPPRTGVEGTIGAANRYQSQQISDNDVVLKDEAVQAFLQSDTFRKIAANPEFGRLSAEAAFG